MKINETLLIQIDEGRLRKIIANSIAESLKSVNLSNLDSNKILDAKSAAAFLNISLPTLHRWKSDGLIPYHQKGGRIFFVMSELIESVKSSK